MTYRLGHHSTSDDASAYRSKDEVQQWTEKDFPILRFRKYLEKKGWWTDEDDKVWVNEVRKNVLKAFGDAEKVKKLPPMELFNDVYAEETLQIKRQREEMKDHLQKYGKHYPLESFQ